METKNAQSEQDSGESPFNYAKIGLSTVEFNVGGTRYSNNAVVEIKGVVGEVDSSSNSVPSMNFDVGNTWLAEEMMKTCLIEDVEDCYLTRTLAHIDSLSSDSGYTSGG